MTARAKKTVAKEGRAMTARAKKTVAETAAKTAVKKTAAPKTKKLKAIPRVPERVPLTLRNDPIAAISGTLNGIADRLDDLTRLLNADVATED